MKFSEYPAFREKTLDPNFKSGLIMPLLEVIFINQQTYMNFTYKVLKEYLFDVQIVYYYPKNFHLVEAINEKIGILKAAGLVQLWMDKYIDKSYINIKPPAKGPREISINQILGGFEVVAFGLTLASLIFIVEMLSKRVEALRNILDFFC